MFIHIKLLSGVISKKALNQVNENISPGSSSRAGEAVWEYIELTFYIYKSMYRFGDSGRVLRKSVESPSLVTLKVHCDCVVHLVHKSRQSEDTMLGSLHATRSLQI